MKDEHHDVEDKLKKEVKYLQQNKIDMNRHSKKYNLI